MISERKKKRKTERKARLQNWFDRDAYELFRGLRNGFLYLQTFCGFAPFSHSWFRLFPMVFSIPFASFFFCFVFLSTGMLLFSNMICFRACFLWFVSLCFVSTADALVVNEWYKVTSRLLFSSFLNATEFVFSVVFSFLWAIVLLFLFVIFSWNLILIQHVQTSLETNSSRIELHADSLLPLSTSIDPFGVSGMRDFVFLILYSSSAPTMDSLLQSYLSQISNESSPLRSSTIGGHFLPFSTTTLGYLFCSVTNTYELPSFDCTAHAAGGLQSSDLFNYTYVKTFCWFLRFFLSLSDSLLVLQLLWRYYLSQSVFLRTPLHLLQCWPCVSLILAGVFLILWGGSFFLSCVPLVSVFQLCLFWFVSTYHFVELGSHGAVWKSALWYRSIPSWRTEITNGIIVGTRTSKDWTEKMDGGRERGTAEDSPKMDGKERGKGESRRERKERQEHIEIAGETGEGRKV